MSSKLTKVLFQLPIEDWYSEATETLWATSLGKNKFRLENSPFYARGYSYQDVVLAEPDPETGFPVVSRVVEKSGHSTYAILVANGIENNSAFTKIWRTIQDLGCTYEGAKGNLLAVNIPPETDVHEVYRLLQKGEETKVWVFQEQAVGHAV